MAAVKYHNHTRGINSVALFSAIYSNFVKLVKKVEIKAKFVGTCVARESCDKMAIAQYVRMICIAWQILIW